MEKYKPEPGYRGARITEYGMEIVMFCAKTA